MCPSRIPSPVGREKVVEDRMRVLICFDARPHLDPLPRGEDFGNHASGDAVAHVADLHLVGDVPRAMTAECGRPPAAAMFCRLQAPANPMTACLTTLLRPGTGALRQVADDEAASGASERFAFRQRANVAQASGHDAAGGGRNGNSIPARGFSRGHGRCSVGECRNATMEISQLRSGWWR